ncbi:MAG TPA: NAD-binding protein [Abditibacterium sp.]
MNRDLDINGEPQGSHRGLSDSEIEGLRDTAADLWRGIRAILPSAAFFALIITVSTTGYIALGWAPFDALYMVVISVFSVGYGEIQPIDTVAERIWTMLVILSGWAGVVVTLGGITKAVTEGELRRATQTIRQNRAMEHLKNHVIICGYGRMGQTLARELKLAKIPFVVVDRDEERVAQIIVEGHLAFRGDATEEITLQSVGITRATTLATVLPQDALNVFITLTARNLSREIKIISRGEQPSTEKKLIQAGANEVILPANIGGIRIAQSIVQPEVAQMLHAGHNSLDLHSFGCEIDELLLQDHSHLSGKTVHEVHKLGSGALMVVAVRCGHEILREHLEDIVLHENDALIVVTRTSHLPAVIARDVKRTELF